MTRTEPASATPPTKPAGGVPIGAAGPKQPVRVDDAYFDAPVCRNCAAPLTTPYCSRCGQKKAQRFAWRDLRRETWEHWRLFEITQVRTLWRLVSKPGYVAREYVLGRRKDHMHPLKLLLFVVALLVLMLNTNRYFSFHGFSTRQDAAVERMATLVQSYGNWSFSLSIFAIFAASYAVFRSRLGYNWIEHAILAVYCQILILAAFLVALLPTLIWDSPEFIADYKIALGRWMYGLKLVVVGLAFRQFFLIDLRREWPRLIAALLAYVAISWALLRVFAFVILKIVQYQLS